MIAAQLSWVAIRCQAVGAAESGLDRRQGKSVGQFDRTDAEGLEDPHAHTASSGMLWTIAWSLRIVSM